MMVQEDNALSHSHHFIGKVYSITGILRLLWPGNSADINMIEPCWFWMKRETTKKGGATSQAEMEKRWKKCWADLDQAQIQAWIGRIVCHIQKIIELDGGNEYKKGRLD